MIAKPVKTLIPLAEGLAFRGGNDFRLEEKLDGRFAVREFEGNVVCGEQMASGEFFAFDMVKIAGNDISQWPLSARLSELDRFDFPRPATGIDGDFLRQVLDKGGEGIVFKRLDAPYGHMWACKRLETFLCVVTGKDSTKSSVAISDAATGQPRGNVALFGGKFDRCNVGSILKIEGFGLTARGMIREPRPCKDTGNSWLVRL